MAPPEGKDYANDLISCYGRTTRPNFSHGCGRSPHLFPYFAVGRNMGMRAVSANWQSVNRREPCPICGKESWCGRNADGTRVACRRLDTGNGIRRVDKAGADYWLYRVNGSPQHHHIQLEILVTSPSSSPPPETLHQFYHSLLGMLPLERRHYQNFHQRGLPDAEITRRQYRTLPTRGRAEFARRLVDVFGSNACVQTPGLYIKEEDDRRWWSLAGAPGLLIPVGDANGHIIALIVRSDDPDAEARYSAVSSRAHRGPGPGAHIHVPLFEKAIPERVRLTEGILKADVATVLSGMLTLGLPGVSAWRQVLPLLCKRHIHTVILAFDADARRNWHVARALQRSAATLRAAGVKVLLEHRAEADGKGIDDLLAAGKTPEVVTGTAVIETIRTIVRAASVSDPMMHRQRLSVLQAHYRQKYRLPAVDSWLGPRSTLNGIPLAVRHLGREGDHG